MWWNLSPKVVNKMNKRYICNLLRKRSSLIGGSGGYFFRSDFDYVAQGIVLEFVPRGLYVWKFIFPLFDSFGPHLSYSSRIADRPFIGKDQMADDDVIESILSSPELRRVLEAKSSMTLLEFASFLEARGLRGAHAHINHAATLALLGKKDLALKLLNELAPALDDHDLKLCDALIVALNHGVEAVKSMLDVVKEENVKKLGWA